MSSNIGGGKAAVSWPSISWPSTSRTGRRSHSHSSCCAWRSTRLSTAALRFPSKYKRTIGSSSSCSHTSTAGDVEGESTMNSLFSAQDLRLIESLQYDPSLSPAFDGIKACLIWRDERPDGLSPAGYETLCDLWIVRGYIHRGIPRENWGIDPTSGYF